MRVSVEASRTSAAREIENPPPQTGPLRSAIIGWGQARIAAITLDAARCMSIARCALPGPGGTNAADCRSAPAQNAFPSPRSNTTRCCWAACSASKQSASSTNVSGVSVLRRSGRASEIVLTSSPCSTRIVSKVEAIDATNSDHRSRGRSIGGATCCNEGCTPLVRTLDRIVAPKINIARSPKHPFGGDARISGGTVSCSNIAHATSTRSDVRWTPSLVLNVLLRHQSLGIRRIKSSSCLRFVTCGRLRHRCPIYRCPI